MHFVKLSPFRGINLDAIVEWRDDPPERPFPCGPLDVGVLTLVFGVTLSPSEDVRARLPYEIQLYQRDRLKMLAVLDGLTEPENWRALHDIVEAEKRHTERKLEIYRASVPREMLDRIEEHIRIDEDIEGYVTEEALAYLEEEGNKDE